METAIFPASLQDVSVGNIWHIIFPSEVTVVIPYIIFTDIPTATWICFNESVTVNFWPAGSYSSFSSFGHRKTLRDLLLVLSIKVNTCDPGRGWGRKRNNMGKGEHLSNFQVSSKQNWKTEPIFTLPLTGRPMKSRSTMTMNDFWCKNLSYLGF